MDPQRHRRTIAAMRNHPRTDSDTATLRAAVAAA